MKITEINIKSFGCINQLTLVPGQGINLIQGKNESGKSTISAFIRFIFFGLNQKEKKDGIGAKERYISWKDGRAAGSITLTTKDNKSYRIERETSGSKRITEQVRVVELETGTIFKDDKPYERFLEGISPSAYDKIFCFSQNCDGKFSGDEIKKALENMTQSANADIDSTNALAVLDKERTRLLYKNEKGGTIFSLEEKLALLIARRDEVIQGQLNDRALELERQELEKKLKEKEQELLQFKQSLEMSRSLYRLEDIRLSLSSKEKMDKAKTELDEFLLENSQNGYYPDRLHLEEVERLIAKKELKKDSLTKLEEKIKECQTKRLSITETSSAQDQTRQIQKQIIEKQKEMGKKETISLLCLTVFAVLLIAGIFLLPLLIPAAACCVLGIYYLSKKSSLKKELSRLQAQSDALDKDNLAKSEALREELSKESTYKEMANRERADLDSLILEEKRLAQKWSMGERELEKIPNNIRNFLTKHESLTREYRERTVEHKNTFVQFTEEEKLSLEEKCSHISPSIPLFQRNVMYIKERELSEKQNQKNAITKNLAGIEGKLAARQMSFPEIEELDRQIYECREELDGLKLRLEAVKTAYKYLSIASQTARSKFAPQISENASLMIGNITGGKYKEVSLTPDTSVTFSTEERSDSAALLSEGTRAAVYLAFRTSLAVSLIQDPAPIILDESLTFFDDTRMKNCLLALLDFSQKKDCQFFIFSCTGREEKFLKEYEGNTVKILKIFAN